MNIQKFTQKSIEAVNDCEKLAYDYGNQEIEQEHLLVALLSQEDGLIPKLIDKMEINVEHFTENAKRHLAARTKVSGSSAQVYVGNDLNKVLIHAEDEAKAMGDEYVSGRASFPVSAEVSKQGNEGADKGVWSHKRQIPHSTFYGKGQSEGHIR